MFQKTTLGGKLSENQLTLLNENYEVLFNTKEELPNSQIIDKLINKALSNDNLKEIDELKQQVQVFVTVRSELENKVNEYEAKNEELENLNRVRIGQISKQKEILEKYVEQAKQTPDHDQENEFTFIPKWLYSVLLENINSEKIQNFYNSLKNKDLYKPLNSDNEKENVINLLLNHFLLRMAKGYPQPQLKDSKKIIYEAFKTK